VTQPIPFRVTRYRCPHCPRTGASKARVREHIGRCWTNPATRGCKTCKHFEPYGPESGDSCAVGVDLGGQKKCGVCFGIPDVLDEVCPDAANHDGDGREVKAGPIVGCDRWEECVRYFCPASGSIECCGTHGGWDTCCDRPELHRPPG
jgi:hypothetical protein